MVKQHIFVHTYWYTTQLNNPPGPDRGPSLGTSFPSPRWVGFGRCPNLYFNLSEFF